MASSVGSFTALALDPGKTTGVCFARFDDGQLMLHVDEGELSLAGIFGMIAHLIQDDASHPLHIIYEDFSYRNASRMGLDLTPVKIIGVIECFREWHEPIVGFYKQSAATGKSFYNNDKLKGLGIYQKGKEHGRDACRHFMQWATFGAGSQYLDLEKVRMTLHGP